MRDFNHIRQWLLPILDAKGISVEGLANAINVNRSLIYAYFVDRCRPETQRMALICRFVGRPLEEGLRQYTPKKRGRPSHKLQPPVDQR